VAGRSDQALPDVGWPDIFNSGVMAFSPGEGKFKEIMNLLKDLAIVALLKVVESPTPRSEAFQGPEA